MFKWLIAFLYSLRRRRRLVLTAAAGSYALTLGSIRRHLRFGVGGGDYRLLGMTVRLTHTKRSERNLSLDAATGYLVAFGYPASLLRGLLLQITDDIPFSLIGYPVVLSKKPPVWSSTLSYTLDEGEVVEATALPVSVPGGGNPFITVSWDSSSVPSTKPDWITLTSGTTPTIAFTGGQTAADDVSSMVITATANGQSQNSSAGSITVTSAEPSWLTVPTVTFTQGTGGTLDLKTGNVLNYDPALHNIQLYGGTTLPTGVTMDSEGVLTYSGTSPVASSSVRVEIVDETPAVTPDSDWQSRISAPGVVASYKPGELMSNYFAGSYGTRGYPDSSIKCSGSAALRLDWLSSDTSANSSGSWTRGSSPRLMGDGFGQNSTFYLQWRERWSSNFVNTLFTKGAGHKSIIIHQNSLTCASLEITMTQYYGGPQPVWYTECGGRGFYTSTTSPDDAQSTPCLLHSMWNIDAGSPWTKETGYEDDYPMSGTGFVIQPNKWYTFDVKVHVGTLYASTSGTKNSTVEVWVTEPGSSIRYKFLACRIALTYDSSPADKYNNFTLTNYCTGGVSTPGVDSSVWYDEVIVSTLPIALPATSPAGG